MKILITGSDGFIGKNFVLELQRQKIDHITYDPKSNGIIEPHTLEFENVTHVVHLGAISSTTETDVKKVFGANLTWAVQLFEECVKQNIHFQWSSSASVYGPREQHEGPFNVSDTCKPANTYAMSKFLLEQYISKRNVSIKTQGFRYFNVYGPNEEHKETQASPYTQFANQAKNTGIIKVFEGSEQIYRDFVHVDVIINTHLEYINKNKSGIFNIGTGMPKTFLDVAKDIALLYDAKIETIPFPDHLKQHYQYYSCAGFD